MKIYVFGKTVEIDNYIDRQLMLDVMEQAEQVREKLKKVTQQEILDLLDKAAALWADKECVYRKRALEEVPHRIGFSPEMVDAGIETMIDMLKAVNLRTRLTCDLGDAGFMNEWTYDKTFKGYVKAQPLGIVAHVSAGNVFVGGVDSLIQGIITKNVNLMKMSTVDPVFPVLFAESLRELDKNGVISGSMALLRWKGGDAAVEDIMKQRCSGIVVYGGADTVRNYRHNLGLHTKLIEYGPKYSFVLADAAYMKERGMGEVARLIARDATMWEQSACSSPHVVYTDADGREMMNAIAAELEYWTGVYPNGSLHDDEAVEITKVRELAKAEKAMGKADLAVSPELKWTVVMQEDTSFQTSCLNRTLLVKPVKKMDDAIKAVSEMGEFIQTVSLATDDETAMRWATELADIGADRFVEPGRMAVRKHGTPHDGTKGLSELVRWVSVSRDSAEHLLPDSRWSRYDAASDHFDYYKDEDRDRETFFRLRSLINFCREHAPLLRERYEGLEFDKLADLSKFPTLTGDDYKAYLPPYGTGLLTSDDVTGFVFASGGTTGSPKLIYRTHEEQNYNAERLGKGLGISVFHEGDVVANLLFAGNLWASFVSFTMALEHTGARILPISGNQPMEAIVNYLQLLGANGIITIPSVLLSVGEYVSKNNIDLKIKKVSTGGEHLFEGGKDYLRKTLGVEEFYSTGYATNDTGAIAYQCKHCSGGVHHVHEDLHYVEIVDPETLEPVKQGEAGKILVTNLQRRLMPSVRYDAGDLGRWIEGSCECGRKTRRFELLGRSDDVLIIGGGNVFPEHVSAAVHSVEGVSEFFQMIAVLDGHLDKLVVNVEKTAGTDIPDDVIQQNMHEQLLKSSKDLKEMVRQGLIAGVEVVLFEPGGIDRNPKTGKIRVTVDERK